LSLPILSYSELDKENFIIHEKVISADPDIYYQCFGEKILSKTSVSNIFNSDGLLVLTKYNANSDLINDLKFFHKSDGIFVEFSNNNTFFMLPKIHGDFTKSKIKEMEPISYPISIEDQQTSVIEIVEEHSEGILYYKINIQLDIPCVSNDYKFDILLKVNAETSELTGMTYRLKTQGPVSSPFSENYVEFWSLEIKNSLITEEKNFYDLDINKIKQVKSDELDYFVNFVNQFIEYGFDKYSLMFIFENFYDSSTLSFEKSYEHLNVKITLEYIPELDKEFEQIEIATIQNLINDKFIRAPVSSPSSSRFETYLTDWILNFQVL